MYESVQWLPHRRFHTSGKLLHFLKPYFTYISLSLKNICKSQPTKKNVAVGSVAMKFTLMHIVVNDPDLDPDIPFMHKPIFMIRTRTVSTTSVVFLPPDWPHVHIF
jgi:hypothetical protein